MDFFVYSVWQTNAVLTQPLRCSPITMSVHYASSGWRKLFAFAPCDETKIEKNPHPNPTVNFHIATNMSLPHSPPLSSALSSPPLQPTLPSHGTIPNYPWAIVESHWPGWATTSILLPTPTSWIWRMFFSCSRIWTRLLFHWISELFMDLKGFWWFNRQDKIGF